MRLAFIFSFRFARLSQQEKKGNEVDDDEKRNEHGYIDPEWCHWLQCTYCIVSGHDCRCVTGTRCKHGVLYRCTSTVKIKTNKFIVQL